MASARATVRFLLDGETIVVDDPDPTATLLDLLRTRLRRTGTKEGCAEGDCGACTVLVGELDGHTVAWRAVNACILFLPMVDGRALMTVESLARDGAPPPDWTALDGLLSSSAAGACSGASGKFITQLLGQTS